MSFPFIKARVLVSMRVSGWYIANQQLYSIIPGSVYVTIVKIHIYSN